MDNQYIKNIRNIFKCYEDLYCDLKLMYDDLIAAINDYRLKEKKQDDLENWWSYPESSGKKIQLIFQYHFRADNCVKGFTQLIMIPGSMIHTIDQYNKLCMDLNIEDKLCPFVIIYGVFEPINITQYNAKEWFQIPTGINNWSDWRMPTKYEYNTSINIMTNIDKSSTAWFTRARVKVIPLLEVKDRNNIQNIANDIIDIQL